jgi:tetrathionate reductase subunit B
MNQRREFLKKGSLMAFLGLLGFEGTDRRAEASETRQWAMIIDLNRCCGCQSCVIACKAQNKTVSHEFNTRLLVEEEGEYPEASPLFTPIQCNQCDDPPCVPACPEKATYKLSNGIVVTDWNKCKAKGDCVSACPYEARFLDQRFGKKSDKCDFCRNRVDLGLEPACVEACSEKARLFGDLKNPRGEFGEYLKRGDLVARKSDFGLKGRVLYVPSRKGRRGGIL